MKDVLDQLTVLQGWQVRQVSAVQGGDINQAFTLTTEKGKRYFMKLNDARRYPQLFEAEAGGLKALQQHCSLKVPEVIAVGQAGQWQYLVMEWLPFVVPENRDWTALGNALAQLHRSSHDAFGWPDDHYLGSLRMQNTWTKDWPGFYAHHRLLPLVMQLQARGLFSRREVQRAEHFCAGLGNRLPEEPPALLHGDLWSGNVAAVQANGIRTVALFDPAVHYGHREVDIALTRLFGGFAPAFYEAYEASYPLAKGWQERLPIFQLSHLLLHAVLFGGSYVSRCKEIINKE